MTFTGGFGFGMSLIHPDDVGGVMNIFEQEIENGTGSLFCTTTWFGKHPSATEQRMENTYASEQRHFILERNENMAYVWSCRPSVKYETINEKSVDCWNQFRRIDSNHRRQTVYQYRILNRLRSQTGSQGDVESTLPELTDRELQILQLLSVGNSSQKIAKQLNISTHTVSTHRKQLLRSWAHKWCGLDRRAQKLGILT